MKIQRRFTQAGVNVYDQFEYTHRASTLRNTDGSVVFQMTDIEVPKQWSQVATDILAQNAMKRHQHKKSFTNLFCTSCLARYYVYSVETLLLRSPFAYYEQ